MSVFRDRKKESPEDSRSLLTQLIFDPWNTDFLDSPFRRGHIAPTIKAYLALLPISLSCWLIIGLSFSVFDLPTNWLYNEYVTSFIEAWESAPGVVSKLNIYFSKSLKGILICLSIGLIGVVLQNIGLTLILTIVPSIIFAMTLKMKFEFGMAFGIGVGVGVASGLLIGQLLRVYDMGDTFSRRSILRSHFQFGLYIPIMLAVFMATLEFGGEEKKYMETLEKPKILWELGLGSLLGTSLGYFLTAFRLILYPIYLLIDFFRTKIDFQNNLYRYDGTIFLPLPNTDRKLVYLAKKSHIEAASFVEFLLECRPLQQRLAMQLRHSALGAKWYNSHLSPKILESPIILQDQLRYTPSGRWQRALLEMRRELEDFRLQNNARLRLHSFEQFYSLLEKFIQVTKAESGSWNSHYLEALEKWEQEATERLEILRSTAQEIISNPYRREALTPRRNREIFLGRKKLYAELKMTILTSDRIPLLLIQGQRRVGKTSFLNFLRQLLGDGFKVIQMDLQGSSDFRDIPSWMETIRTKFNDAIDFEEEEKWEATKDWLKSWSELQEHLSLHSQDKGYKLVIAMDEYEALHEYGMKSDPIQGERLLGAMRSFAQHQDKVAFLFIGVALFSELENPRWSDYFVNKHRIRVDYLTKEDSLQLITRPYDTFRIKYQKEVPFSIYEQTKGHPYLIQLICRELVEIANNENREVLWMEDLDQVIAREIIDEDNGAIATFWHQFCSEDHEKDIVRSIIREQDIGSSEFLKKLKRHEYIIEVNGSYKMRVPLFEKWVKTFHM